MTVRLPPRFWLGGLLLLALVLLQFGGGSLWSSGGARAGGGHRGKYDKFKNERVLVATSFGAHDDVYASLVDTLEDLLLPPPSSRPSPPANSDLDAPSPPVRIHGFGLRYD